MASLDRDHGPHNFRSDPRRPGDEWRRLLAELFGTFLLTFVAAGGAVISAVSHGQVGQPAQVVAPALLVLGMIYTIGDVSGAHLNPAVTLAFALRRDFKWSHVPAYWVVQLIGGILAAALLRALFGNVGELGATLPHHGVIASLVMEGLLTLVLVTVILGTSHSHRLVGHNAALAVSGTIALCGLFASPISGASMNPARSLGPAAIGGHLESSWIYLVGPGLGAIAAALLASAFHGTASADEVAAAVGSDEDVERPHRVPAAAGA